MFDLPILEVATGLALVYLMLSLIVSALNEGIATIFALRARTLRQGLDQLLGEAAAQGVAGHPLVAGLRPRSWMTWQQRPTYIPRPIFVTTVLDLLSSPAPPPAAGGAPAAPAPDLRAAIAALEDPNLRRALLALYDEANGDLEKLKKSLGDWFDHAMERVSGWYRMKVQVIIRVLAFGIAVVVGADTLALTQRLWVDTALRARLSTAAQVAVSQPPAGSQAPESSQTQAAASGAGTPANPEKASLKEQVQAFEALNLPLSPYDGDLSGLWAWFLSHLIGFLLTAAAISLGAPFWFDVLNKLVELRSSGKKEQPVTEPPPTAPGAVAVAAAGNQPA